VTMTLRSNLGNAPHDEAPLQRRQLDER
jgi:hypothetical protein